MRINKTEVLAPTEYAKCVRIEISDPKELIVFTNIYREMATSAMNESDFGKAEELLHVSNQLNEARNVLLDQLAEERDGGEI